MFRLVGALVIVLDIVAIASILGSSVDGTTKSLWTRLTLLLPFIGMILYFAMGPGRRTVV